MKRVFAALFLTLALAAIFTRSDAGLPLRGGSGVSGGSTPLATFLASCATDQWCQPSNSNAVASNVYYGTATGAVDYNATTATDNQGVDGASANWTIWSGGAYDTTLNRVIAFGGLHHSYCGNEGYAFDIPNLNAYRMRTPTDYQTGTTLNISSGTYDSATGTVSLTLSSPMMAGFQAASTWTVASLTGTGSVASLEGSITSTSGASGSTSFGYTAATGLGSITITGGKIFEGCGQDEFLTLNNGDATVAHEYSATVFVPHGSCNTAPDGSWVILQPDGQYVASLDLSKGEPYTALPTPTGAPNSGWSLVLFPQSPTVYGATTPSVGVFDPTTCRIYSENQQIGGGPPNLYYYDLLAQTFSTSGLTGTNGGLPQISGSGSFFTGTARTGHDELWGFGSTSTAAPIGNAMKVALSDGTETVFSLTNYTSLPSTAFPGVCYAASVDKFFIWGGGDTLVVEDAATQTDTTYTPGVAAGVTLPPLNISAGGNNGAMTKMVCDETDHIIVLWWEGGSAPWILKTSKF